MDTKKRPSTIFIILRVAVLAYAGLLLLMTGCQRQFIYYPSRGAEADLIEEARMIGLDAWRDNQGELIGWRAPARSPEGAPKRALVFHGNGGMAIGRDYYARGIRATPGGDDWAIYIFEYPGYGSREGRPSEKVFYEGARAALRQLAVEGDGPVFLVGESLGSGVASRMAAEFPEIISGVLLVTPFTSLADVGARHFRFLPVRLLLRDRYDNVAALSRYRGPVAVLLAEHDEVVPADLGQQLYESYDGPKKIWIQEGRTHNTLDLSAGNPWWDELIRFLEEADQ